jgi:hypothetical protein
MSIVSGGSASEREPPVARSEGDFRKKKSIFCPKMRYMEFDMPKYQHIKNDMAKNRYIKIYIERHIKDHRRGSYRALTVVLYPFGGFLDVAVG